MRVSTKIVGGFGLLLLVAMVSLAYQVSVIAHMHAIDRDLSQVNFAAAETVQKMEQLILDLDKACQKYFAVNGDPLYEGVLSDVRNDFLSQMEALNKNTQTPREKTAIREISGSWSQFWRLFDEERSHLSTDPDAEAPDFPQSLITAIEDLGDKTQDAFDAVKAGIKEQVGAANAAGTQARKFSYMVGGLSLFIAIILAVVIVRAIADPLRQLTHGTRRISKGQFWHRLPADGGDEFAELARDFNSMAQRLSELDQMKKDFVSHVSHELKAPLASMRQVFLLMLQEIAGPLNEQQRKLLRLSSNSAERLSAMVGNLLDVSRMESGTMEYLVGPQNLLALVRAVAEEFEVQAHEKNIQLKVEPGTDTFAECDRDRVVQVIFNLFDNALKFAPEASSITAKVIADDAGKVRVSIIDSGPGIVDEHKHRIFEKFHQIKRGKKVQGQSVGLGLAICKSIVEGHHGRIWVEDNPTGGSIFCFELPESAFPDMKPVTESVSMAGGSR